MKHTTRTLICKAERLGIRWANRPWDNENALIRYLKRHIKIKLNELKAAKETEGRDLNSRSQLFYARKCQKSSRRLWTSDLLKTETWKVLRAEIIGRDKRCLRCGSESMLQVDHILPKALYPFLTFDRANLQTLCQRCNFYKHRIKSTKSYIKA